LKVTEEVQISSAETGQESGIFEAEAEVQEVKVEEKVQEAAGEEEPKKSKGWWRI